MTAAKNYNHINSVAKLAPFIEKIIELDQPFGFDVEAGYTGEYVDKKALKTFHPDWFLVGFSFTTSTDWARYVPLAHDTAENIDDVYETAKLLWKLLRTGNAVIHNASYEYNALATWFLNQLGNDPELGEEVRKARGYFPIRSDTMIEYFMLGDYEILRLKWLTFEVFGHQMTELADLFPDLPASKKKDIRFNTLALSPKVVAYACEDALWCLAHHFRNYDKVKDNLMFKTEIRLTPVLCRMEKIGLYLDWAEYEKRRAEVSEFKAAMNEQIQQDISDALGEVVSINLGSPPQVAKVLFDKLGLPVVERSKTTGAPSTGEKAMRTLVDKHPIAKSILQWREVGKLLSAYIEKYLKEFRYSETAHPSHLQTGAATGRFSVTEVSYQQWPKPYYYELKNGRTLDLNYRNFLIAPPEHRIIGYDFSQVELRILAGMANEKALLKAFADGTDIHIATASAMMGIPVEQVTKKQRSQGKTLNFAVVYGSGAGNIATMLGISKEEAQALLDKYFETFSGLSAWMDEMVLEGREKGFVNTKFGRKFVVREYLSDDSWIKAKGDRMCVNAPVQGGAADYMKLGMVRADAVIRKAEEEGRIPVDSIKLVMTIHDALEFYVHDSVSTQTVIDLIQPAVSFPVTGLPEIRADWHEGKRWGDVFEISLDKEKQITGYSHTVELPDKSEHHWEAKTFAELQQMFDEWQTNGVSPMEPVASERVLEELPEPKLEKLNREVTVEEYFGPGYTTPDQSHPFTTSTGSEGRCDFCGQVSKAFVHQKQESQRIRVIVTEMPTLESYDRFVAFLEERKGNDELIFVTPEGEVTFDDKFSLQEIDHPSISLILGGASVVYEKQSVTPELVFDGLENL